MSSMLLLSLVLVHSCCTSLTWEVQEVCFVVRTFRWLNLGLAFHDDVSRGMSTTNSFNTKSNERQLLKHYLRRWKDSFRWEALHRDVYHHHASWSSFAAFRTGNVESLSDPELCMIKGEDGMLSDCRVLYRAGHPKLDARGFVSVSLGKLLSRTQDGWLYEAMSMRIFLLLAVAAQLACSNAVSTRRLSTQARAPKESDAVNSFAAEQTKSNQFLRSLKTTLEDDFDDGEERAGGNIGKADDIAENMMDDIPSLVAMFKKWKGLTVEEIFKTPAVLALIEKAPNKQFMKVFNLYGEYNLLGRKAFVAKLERMKLKAHTS